MRLYSMSKAVARRQTAEHMKDLERDKERDRKYSREYRKRKLKLKTEPGSRENQDPATYSEKNGKEKEDHSLGPQV